MKDGTPSFRNGTLGLVDGTLRLMAGTPGLIDGTSGLMDGTSGLMDGTSGFGLDNKILVQIPFYVLTLILFRSRNIRRRRSTSRETFCMGHTPLMGL